MFRCITEIKFKQQEGAIKGRNKTLFFNFVNQFSSTDTWVDFTNQAEITLPKNIYVTDENDKLIPLGGVNKNIGGFDSNTPYFLKGDKVEIVFGYFYYDKNGNEYEQKAKIFEGYISEVTSKKPFIVKCEDNMWKLKQIYAPNKSFLAKEYTWEKILKELLKGTDFTVNALTKTNLGDFRTENETVAQVMERVRKDYHLEAYFRGNELRCGSKIYIDSEAAELKFAFQQNIIDDELEYKRKDDVILSAVCYSVDKKELSETTKTGKTKTSNQRLEILVYNQKGEFVYVEKQKGKEYPPNVQGERKTLYFWNVTTAKELFEAAKLELQKFYYTGFKGSFTTFGMPYVKLGDNVTLVDPILPERNGRYKVRSVEYSGGVSGHRQKITLDYKLP
jgi:hypothetical protein